MATVDSICAFSNLLENILGNSAVNVRARRMMLRESFYSNSESGAFNQEQGFPYSLPPFFFHVSYVFEKVRVRVCDYVRVVEKSITVPHLKTL